MNAILIMQRGHSTSKGRMIIARWWSIKKKKKASGVEIFTYLTLMISVKIGKEVARESLRHIKGLMKLDWVLTKFCVQFYKVYDSTPDSESVFIWCLVFLYCHEFVLLVSSMSLIFVTPEIIRKHFNVLVVYEKWKEKKKMKPINQTIAISNQIKCYEVLQFFSVVLNISWLLNT